MKANHPRISYNIQEDERKEFPRRCLILDLDLEFVLIYPRSQCNRAGLEFGRFRAKALAPKEVVYLPLQDKLGRFGRLGIRRIDR
jgi:hypothetical protein